MVDAADALWRGRSEHDLVVVAAPNRAHVPLARAALDAGLHVVVDKPLAARAEDGRGLARAAEEAGRTLAVFQNRRYDGDFLTVRRLMDDGRPGERPSLRVPLRALAPAAARGRVAGARGPGGGAAGCSTTWART